MNNTQGSSSQSTDSQPVKQTSKPSTEGSQSSSKPIKRKQQTKNKTCKRRKFTNAESELIVNCFHYHRGHWDSFWKDPKIQQLNAGEQHLQNHINYLRKKRIRS